MNDSYIAGFFEGEGCISISNKNVLIITIGQKDKTILDKIKSYINYGHIYSYLNKKTNQTYYNLRFAGKHSLLFLKKILPYCEIKTNQINNIISKFEYLTTSNKGRPHKDTSTTQQQ